MLAVTTIPWVQLQATTQLSMRTQRINILPASHDQEMKFCEVGDASFNFQRQITRAATVHV